MIQNEKMITVSDEFVKIYKSFNVNCQIEEMKKLSKKELYLILTLSLDKFSEDDPVVKVNTSFFREELLEIFDIQDDKECANPLLKEISIETGDKYIETDYLVDKKGDKLPEPLNKEQVRDAKINLINKD